MNRLEQELGEGYQRVLLNYLGQEHVVNHGYAPTWWITCDKDTGWCWALAGKMKGDR